jgi:hypothetical protein
MVAVGAWGGGQENGRGRPKTCICFDFMLEGHKRSLPVLEPSRRELKTDLIIPGYRRQI